MAKTQYRQDPVAIIGFACRLPGQNNTPQKLWDFLESGKIANNKVPKTRFNIEGHYDGSHKPGTMRPQGGMFLDDVDLADFDASFFEMSGTEAIAMDPNQRQMLEVVYEGLESAGIPLEKLDGAPVACYVGSYASDYGDMQNRDPMDRPANNPIGVGRAIMANRLSYFLNIKGPSITIDTACSGSLVGLDMACKSLQSGEVDAAIVTTSNLYLNPDHVMDAGNVGQAHSPSALCHTFDISADGYVKAEAVSAIIVKRLSDAIRDCDPIRSIVLGTASNSNGRTGGIASPSSEAQAAAIRSAYANAGISNYNDTIYLECHGTGTQAGDPTEVSGVGSVFAASRPADRPLLIGSIKSNVGHSEPAAGLSGLIKTVMAIEKGIIPGTPLFINPNPKIDFVGNKVKASRTAIPWPCNTIRRASINSFGYGGSNAHAIIQGPSSTDPIHHVASYKSGDEDALLEYDEEAKHGRLYSIVISANDPMSLQKNIEALCNHLANPRVKVDLPDLAYTLSEHRSKLWHRAFAIMNNPHELESSNFTVAKKSPQAAKIGFIFTGQGAQWPQMGKALLEQYPWTRNILEELDQSLQTVPDAPSWSLVSELTEMRPTEHLRQPEFSQPVVTALQLCLIEVLKTWGITPSCVVGHSSGEIAAAYAAGYIDRAGAIKAAFYRGRAALKRKCEIETDVGMLAVGLGEMAVLPFIKDFSGDVWIACFNSPRSVTISGRTPALKALAERLKSEGHFARLLQVDLAYHSGLMDLIGQEYEGLMASDDAFNSLRTSRDGTVVMFSSVTGSKLEARTDALYWKTNMVSPVLFDKALQSMLTGQQPPNILIEIGPSGALKGPTSQVLKNIPTASEIAYYAAWSRGNEALQVLLDLAGQLFITGNPVNMARVNQYGANTRTIIDLPKYNWNYTVKYWHENLASKDWRFKKYITHDLIGSKIPGTSWHAPTWSKHLRLDDVPWLRDHKMGPDVLIPGAGLVTMALEAMFQKYCAVSPEKAVVSPNELCYRFRNLRFNRAVVVEEQKPTVILLSLAMVPGSKDWHEFNIRTLIEDATLDHARGLVRVQDPVEDTKSAEDLAPLPSPMSGKIWYKAQQGVGMGFGPAFQKIISVDSPSGQRSCRTLVDLSPPKSKWEPQSYYPIHPAVLDGCFQVATPANNEGEPSAVSDVMIPSIVDDIVINKVPNALKLGRSWAKSDYTGRGRKDLEKNWVASLSIHDSETGDIFLRVRGLNYVRLDVEKKPDPHTFNRLSWAPDVSQLSQRQLVAVTQNGEATSIDNLIDLIAHKKPTLRVLELNLQGGDATSVWCEKYNSEPRQACSKVDLASIHPESLVKLQSHYESQQGVAFYIAHLQVEGLGLTDGSIYDLVIVKGSRLADKRLVKRLFNVMKPLLSSESYVVVVVTDATKAHTLVDESMRDNGIDGTELLGDIGFEDISSPATETTPIDSDSQSGDSATATALTTPNISETLDGTEILNIKLDAMKGRRVDKLVSDHLFTSIQTFYDGDDQIGLYHRPRLDQHSEQEGSTRWTLAVVRLNKATPVLDDVLQQTLSNTHWSIRDIEVISKSTPNTVILITDELYTPVLKDMDEKQWETLKSIISLGVPLLWVTKGSQMKVTDPNTALVQGFFRVIRREDAGARLTTLDVEQSTGPNTWSAIEKVLAELKQNNHGGIIDTEYAERGGLLYVQRVVPDVAVNEFKRSEMEGADPVVKGLHENKSQVQIRAERIGTLQSLTWCEKNVYEIPVDVDHIEVEVRAVGVNFKDVATTMGIVPENEYMIGCECSGIVRRLGPGNTSKFNIGDRVAVMRSGTYANRIQVPVGRAHVIPPWLHFDDAATIPLVYMTAMYSLFNIGGLEEGQSVLIHSAAGGVGIAAIQLAKYKKADIYVTVGTEEKRRFLFDHFGIPYERMFHSRDARFADEILRASNGRGIDVILNSLTGELLDASWRICADGGTMVEIGKRDIVDRNTLSMEPFDRNCSFRAVDLSYTKDISHELIGQLFEDIFSLVESGHVKPIHPIIRYSFDAVPDALAHIRRGQHIGKLIISSMDKDDIQLPIRPAVRTLALKPDLAYLIVGGLKGLCGSLAVHLARHGARHILVCNRSGINDEASARVVRNCASYACEVTAAKGDVGDETFVRKLFSSRNARPIAGVIQGAMVLRDKPYEMMTLDEYHAATHAKIKGTWNLHKSLLKEQKIPVDFFTMLSSVSGVVGNKGQANYAAANTFLDAFAEYRQSLGLAANSIDLGVIEDVGYVAEQGDGLETRFDKGQWTPINESMLRRILSYSIMQQNAHTFINAKSKAELVTGIAYPLTPNGSDLERDLRFSYLFNRNGSSDGSIGDGENSGNDQLGQAIRAFKLLQASSASMAALVKSCVDIMLVQVTNVLRLETEIEPGKPLVAYGLDSLSAVELRGWVRLHLGAELSTLDITNASSLIALCEKLVGKLPQP